MPEGLEDPIAWALPHTYAVGDDQHQAAQLQILAPWLDRRRPEVEWHPQALVASGVEAEAEEVSVASLQVLAVPLA